MKKANSLLADMTPAAIGRLWSRVDRRADTECWPWLGRPTARGYGIFGVRRRDGSDARSGAHRVVFEVYHLRPIPTDLALDHLCKNTMCVNPHHLEVVTQRENILRGDHKIGRVYREMRCLRGHDLSLPDAFTMSPTGRHCRLCQAIRRKERYERERGDKPRRRSAQEVGCSVDGCDRPHYGKTLCKRHYNVAVRLDRSA